MISWPLLADDGSKTAPSYSFASDPNSGMYLAAADTLAFAAGGGIVFVCDSSLRSYRAIRPNGNKTIDLGVSAAVWRYGYIDTLLAGYGSVSAPAIAFASDTDTGVYGAAAQIMFAIGGSQVLKATASRFDFAIRIQPTSNEGANCGSDGNRWKTIYASGVVNDYATQNGDYTVTATDRYIRENSAGSFTHTLPAAPPNGTTYTFIADGDGALTVAAGGSDTIGGGASISVALNTAMTVVYDATAADWHYITHGAAA